MAGNHALIFGASGITGWAITNQILKGYPEEGSFSKVTALTNRPLSADATLWPKSDKLQLISGLDLMTKGGQNALNEEMKSKVKDMDTVSHVFFFAYIMDPEPTEEIRINVELLKRAVTACEHLSKKLQFVVLPTGTKAYGVHLIDKFPFGKDLPLKESLPKIPEPYASEMFYYNQTDFLANAAKGKPWTWCEVIPDMIVGFVPNNNIYCLPQAIALYLSLYRYINGKGATVEFPGTAESWAIQSNDSFQDTIAKFALHASLNPKTCGNGERFNTADQQSSWSEKWPIVADFFELKGVAPPEGGSGPQPGDYVQAHLKEWEKMEKEKGLVGGRVGNNRSFGGFPYFIMTMFNFDRQQDLTKSHEAWGKGAEAVDAKKAWWTVFERFREAKIIP
ncbi:hypothetical protein EJ08DRAFT_633988 [Tothia fuscella]|uniref:PRISE-like Rossmann-fold domain-containing protein n=1 Tax=Tothia fuscella TaxID=1048955 RepID=A0A9P4TXL4_9PEZI|nr:hypothetical protein EJ08DRAFT_633988 [Tothia fuscella]